MLYKFSEIFVSAILTSSLKLDSQTLAELNLLENIIVHVSFKWTEKSTQTKIN